MDEEELEDVLDSALEEFETIEKEERQQQSASSAAAAAAPTSVESDQLLDGMLRVMKELEQNPNAGAQLEELNRLMAANRPASEAIAATTTTTAAAAAAAASSPTPPPSPRITEDRLAGTLRRIAEQAAALGTDDAARGDAAAAADGDDDDEAQLLSRLLSEVKGEAGFEDALGDALDEIFSKDILYEPLRELRDRYAPFLATANFDDAERARYEQQHAMVQRICALYEAPVMDQSALVRLMADMQQLGAPPKAIVNEMAPELNGMLGGGGGGGGGAPTGCPQQ